MSFHFQCPCNDRADTLHRNFLFCEILQNMIQYLLQRGGGGPSFMCVSLWI